MSEQVVLEVNGVKQLRVELTDILEAAQSGQVVMIRTYTHGRKPRSVLKLEKIEDLSHTAPA